MDMDDPWGSPWADELNNDDGLGTRSIVNVADGSRVGKASEALRNNVNATWGTSDDGFGDWGEDTGKKKGGLGLDGAAEQWDTPNRGRKLEVVKDDVGALSPGWGNSSPSPAREVPKLSPSLLAEPVAIAREPSPDPWATAVSSEESATVEDKVNSGATTTNREPFQEVVEEATDKDSEVESPEVFEAIVPHPEDSDETKSEPEELPVDETAQVAIGGIDTINEEAIGLGIDLEPKGDLCTEIVEEEHDGSDDTVLPSTQVLEHESSRPSSSPSDISHHDEFLPESPRTSLDEEPKKSRTTRTVSPTTQEPVGDLDDLVKPEDELVVEDVEVEEETEGSTKPDNEHTAITKSEVPEDDEVEGSSNAEETDDDEFGDFGDFEEGFSDDGEETVENNDSIKQPISSELATPQNESSDLPKRPTGPVDFSIDLTSVKTLFGEAKEDHDKAVEKIFIPDTIIADTFASTEERKMWYRVSRYGTMRRYNTGDDENYVRISWGPSQVKQETQKTVARWMEEDRNNGHVSLGGTSKGGSLFGWNDPNAPPVPLATILGSKRKSVKLEAKVAAKESVDVPKKLTKEVIRDRSRSKSRSSSKPREHSSTNSVDSGVNIKPPPPPPVAQFGWASSPASQPASGFSNTPPDTGSFMKTFTLPMNSTFGSFGQLSPALPSSAPKSPIEPPPSFAQAAKKPRPISMPPPSTNSLNGKPASLAFISNDSDSDDDDDDDDDEWGEMVSSPIVTEAPKFPTRGLRHKKSMSLGDSLTNSTTLPNPQITKLQSGFGLNRKSKLEQILGLPKSPTTLQSPQLSGTIPSPISSSPSFVDLWSTPASTPVPIQSTALPPPSPAPSATAFSDRSPQPILSSPLNTSFTDTWSQPPPPSISSVSAPPTTNTWSQPPSPSIQPASTSVQDPWASVDFSFFDAPTPSPALATGPAPRLLSKQAIKPRPQSYPAPPKPKTVTFSTPPLKSTPSPLAPAYTSHDSKTKFEMEQDEIVRRIVGGLPNLGYMLRR